MHVPPVVVPISIVARLAPVLSAARPTLERRAASICRRRRRRRRSLSVTTTGIGRQPRDSPSTHPPTAATAAAAESPEARPELAGELDGRRKQVLRRPRPLGPRGGGRAVLLRKVEPRSRRRGPVVGPGFRSEKTKVGRGNGNGKRHDENRQTIDWFKFSSDLDYLGLLRVEQIPRSDLASGGVASCGLLM